MRDKTSTTETVVAAVLMVIFVMTAATKLVGLPMMVDRFAGWGYPTWFMYVVALAELAGAALLYSSRTRRLGAFLIGIIMVGAVATHIRAAEYAMAAGPTILLIPALWLLRPRRPQLEQREAREPVEADADRHASVGSR